MPLTDTKPEHRFGRQCIERRVTGGGGGSGTKHDAIAMERGHQDEVMGVVYDRIDAARTRGEFSVSIFDVPHTELLFDGGRVLAPRPKTPAMAVVTCLIESGNDFEFTYHPADERCYRYDVYVSWNPIAKAAAV